MMATIPNDVEEPASKKQKLSEDEEENQDIAEAIVAAASAAATAAVDAHLTQEKPPNVDEIKPLEEEPLEEEPPEKEPPENEPPENEPSEIKPSEIKPPELANVAEVKEDTAADIKVKVATPDPATFDDTGTIQAAPLSPIVPRIPPAHYVAGIQATTKHDEKWNEMFYNLQDYKEEQGHCLVPQNHKPDIKLGRWVHYQRVEFWLYQQRGQGKITAPRIQVLEQAGFEWDPQRAQWNTLYERLAAFKRVHAHCQVPKGFKQDKELANWVRNQRLEYTNKLRGKKNRMTEDRQVRLEALGFKWSAGSLSLGVLPGEVVVMLPDEVAVAQTLPDEATSEQTLPDESASEQTLPNEAAVEQTLPGESASEHTLPDETAVEQTLSDEVTREQTLTDEAAVVQTLPDEAAVVQTLPDEVTREPTLETIEAETPSDKPALTLEGTLLDEVLENAEIEV